MVGREGGPVLEMIASDRVVAVEVGRRHKMMRLSPASRGVLEGRGEEVAGCGRRSAGTLGGW